MTALPKPSNVHHLPPRPVVVTPAAPPSVALLQADYAACAAAYLFALLNGAPREIICRRAAQLYMAREALRDRGVAP
ncbi:MAG: hypothetical protein Q8M26_08815 [Pseudolabrys sp.]|nr:hypothetical protein [Pseudolabrys sp.]